MRAALALPVLAGVTPAGATASLSCSAQDRAVSFAVEAVVSHGVGEVVTGFRGEAILRLKGIPDGFRPQVFESGNLTQAWIRGRDVKIRIYRDGPESGPRASVELVIETRGAGGDATDFRGTYELSVEHLAASSGAEARTAKARGKAACSLG